MRLPIRAGLAVVPGKNPGAVIALHTRERGSTHDEHSVLTLLIDAPEERIRRDLGLGGRGPGGVLYEGHRLVGANKVMSDP